MGHSQSYDLKNPEQEEKTNKDPVRGVRRTSKEHQTDTTFSAENTENFDNREDDLRERIRNEQLVKREAELESMRIRQHESRGPIIDAYRTTSQPSPMPTVTEPQVYKEFNYYDSLKHPHPVDPTTYFALRPSKEVNEGQLLPMVATVSDYSIPKNLSPTPRYIPPMNGGTYSKRTVETTVIYTPKRKSTVGTVPPQYDTVPGEAESWEKIRAPHYDEVPVVIPVSREGTVTYRTPTPVTMLEKEVPMVPLTKRAEVPYPSEKATVVPVGATVIHRTPTPIKTPSPVPATVTHRTPTPLEKVHLVPEVSKLPLDATVIPRTYVPYQAAKAPVPLANYRTPTVPLENTHLAREQPEIPLRHTVAYREPVPYGYSNPVKPTTVPLEQTPLAQDLSKMPLGSTVTHREPVPYPSATVTQPLTQTPEPFTRHPELPGTPLGHHITFKDPQSNYDTYSTYRTYSNPSTPTQVSEIHAEKRMIVGVDEAPEETPEAPENVSYVTVAEFPTYSTATSPSPTSDDWSLEQLHRQPEVHHRPVYVRPSQQSYQAPPPRTVILPPAHKVQEVQRTPQEVPRTQGPFQRTQETQYSRRPSEEVPRTIYIQEVPRIPKEVPRTHYYQEVPKSQGPFQRNQETQYSRRPSEDVRILEQQKPKTCQVENCTHVEVRDSPVVARRRISEEEKEKENNNLKIYIDEREMDGVIDLAKDEDVGLPTSTPRRCFEEKLHYNSYFPTLSLGRRPVVSFYDKLH